MAGTWKNPAAPRADALVTGAAGSSLSARRLHAQGCEGDRCLSTEQTNTQTATLELRPLNAASLWVEGGRAHQQVGGTGHRAAGWTLAAGVHLVLPRQGWRPAISAQASRIATTQTSPTQTVLSDAEFDQVEVAGFAVWGSSDDQLTLWLGPSASVHHQFGVDNLSTEVDLWMDPRWPAELVAGAEVWSEPLGPPWGAEPRLRAGVEARGGATWSMAIWLAVSG